MSHRIVAPSPSFTWTHFALNFALIGALLGNPWGLTSAQANPEANSEIDRLIEDFAEDSLNHFPATRTYRKITTLNDEGREALRSELWNEVASSNLDRRRAAIVLLALCGDEQIRTDVVAEARDPDSPVRRAAVSTLGHLGGQAVSELVEILRSTLYPMIEPDATLSTPPTPLSEQVRGRWIRDLRVREDASKALVRIATADPNRGETAAASATVLALIDYLSYPNIGADPNAEDVLRTLASLGGQAKGALPVLQTLYLGATDPVEDNWRESLLRTIEAIDPELAEHLRTVGPRDPEGEEVPSGEQRSDYFCIDKGTCYEVMDKDGQMHTFDKSSEEGRAITKWIAEMDRWTEETKLGDFLSGMAPLAPVFPKVFK